MPSNIEILKNYISILNKENRRLKRKVNRILRKSKNRKKKKADIKHILV